MISSVQNLSGVPTLFVNGTPVPGFAYITYRTYNSRCGDFAGIGCTLFSVPVFFAGQTINESTQIPPMSPGIFDGDTPDFSRFDADVAQILSACPDAYIFPRVNLSLPETWEREHPGECCDFSYREHHRACVSSDAWAEETTRLLDSFLDHVEAAPYREHIVGYQLAGGGTEEWFGFDLRGSVGPRTREAFAAYCAENRLSGTDEEYRRFLSVMTARRILEFAAFAKKKTERRLVIGCFYGYTMECVAPEQCHHALGMVLASEDIDFLCSPVSYAGLRPVGTDHACMLPVDSVKLHGKLYFAENDTRTHLSEAPNELPAYNTPIWFGPAPEQTCEIIKMHFARALTHGHAMWWFDMWGGWYADARYLSLLRRCRAITAESLHQNRSSRSEMAVFVDERAYALPGARGDLCYHIRRTLGHLGTPYDIYLIDDYPQVHSSYKACIFLAPADTDALLRAVEDAGTRARILRGDPQNIAIDDIRTFCRSRGVHIWCAGDVVYACGSYLFLHTAYDGEHDISLPQGMHLTELFTGEPYRGPLTLAGGCSRLYAITED